MRIPVLLAIGAMFVAPLTRPATGQAQDAAKGSTKTDSTGRADNVRRFREALEKLVRERLNLREDQLQKLRTLSDRLQEERTPLMGKLHTVFTSLRTEMEKADSAVDQSVIASLLDQSMDLRQQMMKVDLEEQRELARFLSPLQRAKYIGLQHEVFKMMAPPRRDKADGKTGDKTTGGCG